jgi:hypothetical protein
MVNTKQKQNRRSAPTHVSDKIRALSVHSTTILQQQHMALKQINKQKTYSLAVQKYNPPAVGKVEQISAMPRPINMTKKATSNQPQMMATGPPVAIPNPNKGTIPINTDEFVRVNPKF